RQVLARVVAMLKAKGLTPVVALEMEFYLVDPVDGQPLSPKSPVTGKRLTGDRILSLEDIDHFDGFFADVYAACADYGIPADAAISEGGAGQFEINLLHIDDSLRAADNAQFFKRIVKGVARKHGFAASFMAKPYLDRAGSGMHVHFSMLDTAGDNIFNDGSDAGSEAMRHAVAGLLDCMAGSTLIFAPHLNSYRRLCPGAHAPTGIGWGYENRTTAIRIPGGLPAARRIEHRVSGADANPYLLVAAILAGALHGLNRGTAPADPITGNAYEADLEQLPADWQSGIVAFEGNAVIPQLMSAQFHQMFSAIKRQELNGFADRMSNFEIGTYLESI
ncbi:MAG: glutamine synthetase, partial [Rhodobacteraceae bacterium]|nr:glutamine synthetase [Paracoccaceae bacterium]